LSLNLYMIILRLYFVFNRNKLDHNKLLLDRNKLDHNKLLLDCKKIEFSFFSNLIINIYN
jgi:hypothetical protein